MSSYRELMLERVVLDKQIESARAAELEEVVNEIKQKMQDYGIRFADLGMDPKRGSPSNACIRVGPKYVNPENPNQTWSGRGKAPKWMAGKNRADCLIPE